MMEEKKIETKGIYLVVGKTQVVSTLSSCEKSKTKCVDKIYNI